MMIKQELPKVIIAQGDDVRRYYRVWYMQEVFAREFPTSLTHIIKVLGYDD